MVFAAGLEGGVRHDSDKKCGKATFLYLSHSAVVIHFESARPCRAGEKGGDESDPPKAGGHVTLDSATERRGSIRPMGSLSSSFIPAGRLGTAPQERR